jgi:pimeloyl-ACP methyl ester carboxylesterase
MPPGGRGHEDVGFAGVSSDRIRVNDLDIAYETFGSPTDPPLLLVMGLGTQMVAWPDPLCTGLAERGHYVIRFDNRDVGLSSHLDGVHPPSYLDVVLRGKKPPYTIEDMAQDALGLLDGLGIDQVHLVGASMGGFIAQSMALARPERVATLTLMMTSTGSRLVGNPKPDVFVKFLRRRVARDRASAHTAALEIAEIIRSKGYAFDAEYFDSQFNTAYERGYDFEGYLRQLAAVGGQPNRTKRLRGLRTPTLVVHGLHDPLVAASGGLALARLLPNSRFVGFSGMGHDLPRELWPVMVTEISALTAATPIRSSPSLPQRAENPKAPSGGRAPESGLASAG